MLAHVVSALQALSFDLHTALQGLLSEDQRMEGMERVTVCFLKILQDCLRLASPLSETWVAFAHCVIKIFWRLTGLYRGHTYYTQRLLAAHAIHM